jgi:hypothetical protein
VWFTACITISSTTDFLTEWTIQVAGLPGRKAEMIAPARSGSAAHRERQRGILSEAFARSNMPRAHTRRECMKAFRCLAFFVFAATTCIMNGPAAFAARPQNTSPPLPSAVRILTPSAGEALVTDYVNVKYELVRPSLSDEPNFLVQLDAADPVQTSETSHTFSDVQPGVHTIRVTLVDANNSPVQGGPATVQFKTTTAPPLRDGSRGAPLHLPRYQSRQNCLQTAI